MKIAFYIFTGLLILSTALPAQISQDPEYWREKGYQARVKEMPDSSLYYYNKVLEINPNDWDALLATARLHFYGLRMPEALDQYMTMFENDSTDLQALNGLGLTYIRMGDYEQALKYLNLALYHSPEFVPSLMGKAKILGDNGDITDAITIYDAIIRIEPSLAEAYAGKATMMFWSNRPNSALPLYEKAYSLDPTNTQYKESAERMRRIIAYTIGLSYTNVVEQEFWEGQDVYSIKANIEHLYVSKRLTDYLALSLGAIVDFSNKETVDVDTVKRRFDNYYVSAQLIRKDHSLTGRFGYSLSDKVPAAYGVAWSSAFRIKKLRISNTIGYNYDYFYYWNKVSRDYVNDRISLNYKKWSLESSLMKGKVRPTSVFTDSGIDTLANPFTIVRSGLSFRLVEKPRIAIALMHEWRNFTNKSPMYWSPYRRSLFSPGLRISHEWKHWYAYGILNVGMDNYDVSNVDGSAELGYSAGRWLIALGYGAYSNIYYKNSTISLVLKIRL